MLDIKIKSIDSLKIIEKIPLDIYIKHVFMINIFESKQSLGERHCCTFANVWLNIGSWIYAFNLLYSVLFKVCEENLASQKYISEKGNNSSTALSDNYGYASILDQNLGSGRCLKVDFNMESENRLL